MWRFYGFVHEIVGAIHEMWRFYGFVCLIMLEGGVGVIVWVWRVIVWMWGVSAGLGGAFV